LWYRANSHFLDSRASCTICFLRLYSPELLSANSALEAEDPVLVIAICHHHFYLVDVVFKPHHPQVHTMRAIEQDWTYSFLADDGEADEKVLELERRPFSTTIKISSNHH
jgi:hypothetical protein